MPSETAAAKWRRWLHNLRSTCPTKHPVTVRRVALRPLIDVYGDCDLKPGGKSGPYFLIRIDAALPLGFAFMILLHEYAHALTWFDNPDHDHGAEWGTMFAELWREYMQDGDYEPEDE